MADLRQSTPRGALQHPRALFCDVLRDERYVWDERRHHSVVCVSSLPHSDHKQNELISLRPVADNLGSESKKATGLPLFQAIGQCGALLGSHMYPLTEGPRYM